jgi:replicative DNA helicase
MNALVPPHDITAEQCVLGSLLLDNGSLDLLDQQLKAADFYHNDHKRIYETILEQIMSAKVADVITVAEAGYDLAYLGSLAANTPNPKSISRYAGIVRDKARERDLLAAIHTIGDLIQRVGLKTKDKLDESQALIMAISDANAVKLPQSMRSIMLDVIADLMAQVNGEVRIPGTGYERIDEMAQLWIAQNLIILAGRPSMGKTAIAINLAFKFAEEYGEDLGAVLICSQEMSNISMGKRALAYKGNIPLGNIMRAKMTEDEYDRMQVAGSRLSELNLFIDEQGSLNLIDVRTKARQVKRQHGLGLLVIDYLQLMVGEGENRQQEITAISRGLKALAKELNIPVLALSQLNRGVESRPNKRPMMSDLRESGAIEQDADVIVFMYRDDYYYPDSPDAGLAEFIIAKQRNGATGTVRLVFEKETQRFLTFAGESASASASSMPPMKNKWGGV